MLVDLTFYGMNWIELLGIAANYHQGLDGFDSHGFSRQTTGDKNYNVKFKKGDPGSLMKHGKYYFDSNGVLKTIHRKKYKHMHCSFLL